ncbi:MAG: winged helix-turn-helix transcriptional regulator [Lachnospiraceae bacterium]|nr:winged helix-turn-helix transcriptional regulator [Lachnospiraceae bacterium]
MKMIKPDEQNIRKMAGFFKVFGDETRIRILSTLSEQEMCVQDIADSLSMTQSAISHQLSFLKQMDLVRGHRDGKTIYYSLADDHIVTILSQGLEHIME